MSKIAHAIDYSAYDKKNDKDERIRFSGWLRFVAIGLFILTFAAAIVSILVLWVALF